MPTVRLFAAAREAAGTSSVDVDQDTLPALVAALGERFSPDFARVLQRCSLLVNGARHDATDSSLRLMPTDTVDVLPPFAGG